MCTHTHTHTHTYTHTHTHAGGDPTIERRATLQRPNRSAREHQTPARCRVCRALRALPYAGMAAVQGIGKFNLTLQILNSRLSTQNAIPFTLYPIPYTLYPILYTLYPIPYILTVEPLTLNLIPQTICRHGRSPGFLPSLCTASARLLPPRQVLLNRSRPPTPGVRVLQLLRHRRHRRVLVHVCARSYWCVCAYVCMYACLHVYSNTHTQSFFLSLSLSLSHTHSLSHAHAHTHTLSLAHTHRCGRQELASQVLKS